ncbi:MAG TPA: twin-arginine translocase subunit TatC [Candidatus Krumholzibacteria bacterium]|nr:twin-arginine translocase subunit TatC [Candidatus Krumholzibacteria bacterium]
MQFQIVPPRRQERLHEMHFLEHLDQLRGVITASVLVFLAFAAGYFFFSGTILEWMVRDVPVDHFVFHSPSEAFMVRTKLSLILGIMTAFPYIGYRIWKFVMPGLFKNEKSRVMPIVVWSVLLFYAGVAFCYFMVAPGMINFLVRYGTAHVQPLISISAYFDTVAQMCLLMGLVFQLPIVMFLLSLTGLVSPQTFLRQWRYAILIIFIVAAIATPSPDPVSQTLMATPLCLLYIGSALVALFVSRRREKTAS